jgi:energy-coupling factor transporter ATP-binding protein EcfA2
MEIKVNNVKYQYKNSKKPVIANISMKIQEGSITGIIGKSGSGKTTLLEMFNALRLPQEGSIEIGDFKISKDFKNLDVNKLRFKVGMVFQSPEEQFFSLTVREELELPLKYYGYNPTKISSRMKDALLMVDLEEDYLSKRLNSLSNGEKRKIALASILVLNPDILILDEPTVGLDYENIKSFLKLIRTLKTRYHKTVIIASHDTELLHKMVDYLYVISDGKVVMEGNKYEVFKKEEELKKYGIKVPNIISFSNKVLKNKNIKIGYRDEINDLIKDIYRYVR